MISASSLPTVNALLNATSAILLAAGYLFIRARQVGAHRLCMLAAVGTSTLFLASYVTYHYQVGSERFDGQGWTRPIYYSILISHTILAAAVVILRVTKFSPLRGDSWL